MTQNSQNSSTNTSTSRRRFRDVFKEKNFLGVVERAIGVWYPDPDEHPDDTNPLVQTAFRNYLIKRYKKEYYFAPREDHALGVPDLVLMKQDNGSRYDVVTCYRSQMFIGEDDEPYLPWTTQETYDKLCAYRENERNPIFVVIGLHGYADEPRFLFCVPLDEAEIDLKKSVLSKYEIGEGENLSL